LKEEKISYQEAQAKMSEGLENTMKKQSEEIKAMMTDMMVMMKQQQQP